VHASGDRTSARFFRSVTMCFSHPRGSFPARPRVNKIVKSRFELFSRARARPFDLSLSLSLSLFLFLFVSLSLGVRSRKPKILDTRARRRFRRTSSLKIADSSQIHQSLPDRSKQEERAPSVPPSRVEVYFPSLHRSLFLSFSLDPINL